MIATTASRQYLMMHHHVYQIGRMRYELFVRRLECLQEEFASIAETFDVLGQKHGIDFEDMWREAAQLIVDDSRFVLFSSQESYAALERGWNTWFARLVKRIDDRRSHTYRVIDSSVQVEALQGFIGAHMQHRAYIARLSRRLLDRLFVDVPYRLFVGDVGGACRASANVLNTVGNAISSPLSSLGTTRR